MKNFSLIILGVLAFWSCQKVALDDNTADTPVFKVQLNVDGEIVSMTAGDNDYYQFTEAVKTDDYNENIGHLRQIDCDLECAPELKITFRTSDNQNSFPPRRFTYFSAQPSVLTRIRATFDAFPSGTPPFEHQWLFEDGTQLTGAQVSYDFVPDFDQVVKLTSMDSEGCVQESERNIMPSQQNAQFNCPDYRFFIDPLLDSAGFSNSIFLIPISSFGAPDSVMWQDGSTNLFFRTILSLAPIQYCATIFDFDGCPPVEICTEIADQDPNNNQFDNCIAQFTYQQDLIFEPNDLTQLETVLIEYTDELGVTYSSALLPQDNATFSVQQFEDYEDNENGQPTLKFEGDFTCKVASIDGDIKTITSEELSFAVGK